VRVLFLIICMMVIFLGLTFPVFAYAEDIVSSDQFPIIEIGEEIGVGGVVFNVDWARISYWKDSVGEKPSKEMLALKFNFRNIDKTKKYDLSKGFNFELTDEYGNSYWWLSTPEDYEGSVENRTDNFPSLYPTDKYSKVVFFEAPIQKSESLYFTLDVPDFEIDQPIVVKIPINKVSVSTIQTDSKKAKKAQKVRTMQMPNELRIMPNLKKRSVVPGDKVSLVVQVLGGNVSPKSIFVILPHYVLEDTPPTYKYDVVIPKDQNEGKMTVIVVGKWIYRDEEVFLSDSLILDVSCPGKCCKGDPACLTRM